MRPISDDSCIRHMVYTRGPAHPHPHTDPPFKNWAIRTIENMDLRNGTKRRPQLLFFLKVFQPQDLNPSYIWDS